MSLPLTSLQGLRILLTQADTFMGPALQRTLTAAGADVQADTRDPAPPEAAAQIVAAAGEIDVLVAHLAVPAPTTAVADVDEAEWRAVFAALVDPLPRLARAVLPGMLARGGGKILLIGSAAALRGQKRTSSYSAARDLAGAPRGLIRLTAPVALGRQHLAPSVAAFLQHYPDIQIELALTDRFVNLASEGFDLAIRHTSAPPETHVAWALCETRSQLLASPQYLARRGVPAHPSELAAHNCLLYLRDSQAASWTFARPAPGSGAETERIGVNVSGSLKANNSEVLREALLAGLGIGLLPDFSLPPAPADGGQALLVPVLPGWQPQGFFGDRIYALRPWSAQAPKAVQCLVAHLRQSFSERFPLALKNPPAASNGCQKGHR